MEVDPYSGWMEMSKLLLTFMKVDKLILTTVDRVEKRADFYDWKHAVDGCEGVTEELQPLLTL
jgi:hypothetical protein